MTDIPMKFLTDMLGGYRAAMMVRVALQLNIPDHMLSGAKHFEELSQITHTHADSLYRLLRSLAGLGLLIEAPSAGTFELTALGSYLRADHPSHWRDAILYHCGESHWKVWGDLLYSVQTGETAFQHIYGSGFFDYFKIDPETGQLFDRAMTSASHRRGQGYLAAYDFSSFRRVVDIGGGNGAFLARILQKYPDLLGVLFDLPSALELAPALLEAAGVQDRCTLIGGNFFDHVPTDCDLYILKTILHDWDDANALRILKNCRAAMPANAKILVIDQVMPERIEGSLPSSALVWLDLEMLLFLSGRERTESQFRKLFTDAGLSLDRVLDVPNVGTMIEGSPAAITEP